MARREALVVAAVALFIAGYGAWFIFRSSVVVSGQRYFVLFDDAMISMTHAKNFVDGFGLSWARWGHPVEGFSCPLWTLLMIPLHWLPLSEATLPLVVQVAGVLTVIGVVLAVRCLVDELAPGDPGARGVATVLTATYSPLLYWSLMGMETGLQTLLITSTLVVALRARRAPPRFVLLGGLLGVSILLRPDMLLLAASVVAALLLGRRLRLSDARGWLTGAALVAIPVAAYQVFRLGYYGAWLPNTYYLKLTDVDPWLRGARGLSCLLDSLRPFAWVALLAGVAIASRLSARPAWRLPFALLVLHLAYSVYVGGDAWEAAVAANRFVTPVMPAFFALLAALVPDVREMMARFGARLSPVWLAAGALLVAASVNGMLDARVGRERTTAALGIHPPAFTADAAGILRGLEQLQRLAHPSARVAVVWAGIPAYYAPYEMVDTLGYNDPVIARGPASERLRRLADSDRYLPGHMKWSFDHTLGTLAPDVVFQTWKLEGKELEALMKRYGYRKHRSFWVKEGSAKVRLPRPLEDSPRLTPSRLPRGALGPAANRTVLRAAPVEF